MPLYHLSQDAITEIDQTSFSSEGIRERSDLQRILRDSIDVITKDTLVISEEFFDWEDSKVRIDLLGIDKNGNLVVIELKRDDSAQVELQAIRYAAMVAKMPFHKAVEVFQRYLEKRGRNSEEAESLILDFLGWEEPEEHEFAQDVRLVLAGANFRKEVTTAVMWLIDRKIDIRCVRLQPYRVGDRILLDVQQIIPLPEATDYQVRMREKEASERQERISKRDTTRYDIDIDGTHIANAPKRSLVYHVVRAAIRAGATPDELVKLMRSPGTRWITVDGIVQGEKFREKAEALFAAKGTQYDEDRFFISDDELFHIGGKTHALTKMWGRFSIPLIETILRKHPGLRIKYTPLEKDSS